MCEGYNDIKEPNHVVLLSPQNLDKNPEPNKTVLSLTYLVQDTAVGIRKWAQNPQKELCQEVRVHDLSPCFWHVHESGNQVTLGERRHQGPHKWQRFVCINAIYTAWIVPGDYRFPLHNQGRRGAAATQLPREGSWAPGQFSAWKGQDSWSPECQSSPHTVDQRESKEVQAGSEMGLLIRRPLGGPLPASLLQQLPPTLPPHPCSPPYTHLFKASGSCGILCGKVVREE